MRNIIITGGELFNKGAQAMVFVTVDELKRRFPDHEIFLLSAMDLQRPREEREQYAFQFTGWYPIKFARAQTNLALRLLCSLRNREEYLKARTLYENCDMMVDISGYALGSNWGYDICNTYLEHLEFAKAFGIPCYLMPQSFGPFDFRGTRADELERRMRGLLPGVKQICAREQDGYHALVEQYGLTNVCLKTDLVLNNREINLKHIYKTPPLMQLPEIETDSVGIVPNGRTIAVKGQEFVLALYRCIIKHLVSQRKNIYLLSHCTADRTLCTQIQSMFPKEPRLVFLDRDFSCLEFNALVQRFGFVIASRFHSIVHAYKNGIPCISLGWAVKYHDLLAEFEQEQYAFDVRDNLDTQKILEAIDRMDKNSNEEAERIRDHLKEVQEENVFDILSL